MSSLGFSSWAHSTSWDANGKRHLHPLHLRRRSKWVTDDAQSIPDEPEFIGQTEASRIVEIRSQVTGIIKERYYEEGRDVKKGDPLYQIDPIPFRAAMLSAQAKVSQAEARLVQAKQNLVRVAVEVVVKRPVLPLKIPTGAVKRAFAAIWIW